jgi:transposase-like protein
MPRHRTAPYARRRRWTSAEARAALAALGKSGLTASAFAQQEGLDVERLRRWRRRLVSTEQLPRPATGPARAPELIELRPHQPQPVEIVLRSGILVRVPETIDPSMLARLVSALERREC